MQRMRSELPGPTDPLDPAAFVPKPRAKDRWVAERWGGCRGELRVKGKHRMPCLRSF